MLQQAEAAVATANQAVTAAQQASKEADTVAAGGGSAASSSMLNKDSNDSLFYVIIGIGILNLLALAALFTRGGAAVQKDEDEAKDEETTLVTKATKSVKQPNSRGMGNPM